MSAVIKNYAPGVAADAFNHISELTGAKVRIFLAEVAEGVSNYRSLHSLTEQVEHQYHGRFLIELVQNAHDAFDGIPSSEKPNRIEIVFDPTDSKYGSLFVANDGMPFSPSNFERLSQLGQSDKDPQKSIGNKGIGFRSVLEVSACPEVYSRSSRSSKVFDGYCFAFRPEVVQALVEPMTKLAAYGPIPISPLSGAPLVDWSEDMLAKFRGRVQSKDLGWLVGEAKYLSPYLLPVPLTELNCATACDFEARGFATVVRLPLKSSELCTYVLEHMERLSSSTVLFLDKVSSLTLRVVNAQERDFTRTSLPLEGDTTGVRISIDDSAGTFFEYAMWSRSLHVPSAPEKFRDAVRALPGRWPEIVDISISVAVRLGDIPEAGRFSIYLPTLVATGSAVHVNAPFFGDMSRTSIPFDDAYNHQLLQTAGDLALDAVRARLAARGQSEARAIVDLLAPFGSDQAAAVRWLALMKDAALRASASLDEEPLILAEQGWRPLNMTSLVPTHSKATLLTEELLRRHATFNIFHPCLNSRSEQLKALALSRFSEPGAFPLVSDIAATIASIASEMQAKGGDWNLFWRDVMLLLPNEQKALAEHAVILGADGKLHSIDSGSKVFFVPRQGTQDDGDVGGEGTSTEVPPSLQHAVAFLNDQIQLYDTNKPTVQTAARAYLGNGLVSQFRVDTIFTGVLQELTPHLPVPVDGPHFELCHDIMRWALRLIGNVVARGRGAEATLRLLRTIPVPCHGGWYPMGKASFGEGWPGTIGSTLKFYLDSLKSPVAAEARKRLLLPLGHPAWGDIGVSEQHLLVVGGVFDGLRLHEVRSDAWTSQFQASYSCFCLPILPPPSFTKVQWSSYKTLVQSEVKPNFTTLQPYGVGALNTFPGFEEMHSLLDEARLALSELLLQSLPHWVQGLAPLEITKKGGLPNLLRVTSPINFFLQSTPWLGIRDAKGITWARPRERWHVPADALAGRSKHYVHLNALPSTIARRLDTNEALAKVLRNLGMPHFDLHSETASPALLEALTASTGNDDGPDSNVLLGQIRDAWHRFRPTQSQPPLKQLVVRRHDKQLDAMTPTNEAPLYLPDSGAYVNELEQFNIPVLSIYTDDAKDLKEWFATAYGGRVQLTSRLELVPHVNGIVWSGVSAVPLADSELGWIIRPLLAMVAFHGQFRGIHSAAFQDRANLLRETCIDWVPNVSVVVMRGDSTVITAEVPALWDVKRKTIIASELCRKQLGELSTSFSQALGRSDLELPIRYVLSSLESADAEPEDVATFLAPLRISPEQVQQVIEHLRGDVGHMGRLVHSLATVLAPEVDASVLLVAKTDDELVAVLTNLAIAGLDVQSTLKVARESQDMFDFGRTMWRDLGETVGLSRWNQMLLSLGQPLLGNRNWAIQLQAGLEEASGLLKRLLANLVRQDNSNSFLGLWATYEGLSQTVDLSQTHWAVDFQGAMNVVASLLQSWKCGDILVNGVRESISAQDLREKLRSLGVPLDIDPDECARKNHQLVDTVVNCIEKYRLAWWLKSCADGQHGEWKGGADKYRSVAAERLSNDAFTQLWSEAEVFALLRSSAQHVGLTDFWSAMLSSSDLASLRLALKLTEEELAGAESKLAGLKADFTRKRNLIKVCGEDFDCSDDNLDQLWNLLTQKIPDESLTQNQSLDLGKLATLTTFKTTKGKVRPDIPPQPTKTTQHQSKSVDELVGLAGEIFVYRMLQQKYGSDTVTPSAWVSGNSQHVFPYNQADDSRGCDFAFTVKGKLLRVEVKSSTGNDEAFKLGSSEIRLALDLAIRGKRRREVFVLVQVKNALSATPTAVVLPNPYDPKFSEMFSIEAADARIRYRAKK
jgi:hypothetical protein